MTDEKAVLLSPPRVICGRHGEVFRERWPLGYPLFVATAMDCLNHNRSFASAVQARQAAEDEHLTDSINYFLSRAPICCRLSKPELLEVLEMVAKKSHPWERARCYLCRRHAKGARYRKKAPTARDGPDMAAWGHVCLHCVAFGVI